MILCTKCHQIIHQGKNFLDSRWGQWHMTCVEQAKQEHHYVFGVTRLMNAGVQRSFTMRMGLHPRKIPYGQIRTGDPQLDPSQRQSTDRLPLVNQEPAQEE